MRLPFQPPFSESHLLTWLAHAASPETHGHGGAPLAPTLPGSNMTFGQELAGSWPARKSGDPPRISRSSCKITKADRCTALGIIDPDDHKLACRETYTRVVCHRHSCLCVTLKKSYGENWSVLVTQLPKSKLSCPAAASCCSLSDKGADRIMISVIGMF